MNIEVGDYVRTKGGNIFKIIGGNSDNYDIDIDYGKLEKTEINWFESNRYNDNGYFFTDNDIKIHSPNIIDLIEIGDYVNGEEVKHIADFEGIEKPIKKVIFVDNHNLIPGETARNDEIKTIVTKEQFKEMEYKIKE